MRKKLLPIPTFKTIPEEADFWDTHDSTDYAWEEVKNIRFSKNLKSIYTSNVLPIRLDEKIKKAIEKVAKKKGIKSSDAASILIQERLMQLKVV
ncbi:MAG: hypothetical protein A3E40_04470 [Candidatus Levybacteria bacterium RIFCSPHIGHO2_12_FULL_37_9]|nr:MAG: hypothetical protein A3E40_04470 [Candidatus Levybacteria bacterium RIFCSPHIGHO2_12_FULL_37_9]